MVILWMDSEAAKVARLHAIRSAAQLSDWSGVVRIVREALEISGGIAGISKAVDATLADEAARHENYVIQLYGLHLFSRLGVICDEPSKILSTGTTEVLHNIYFLLIFLLTIIMKMKGP